MKKTVITILVLSLLLAVSAFARTSEYELKTAPDSVVIDGVLSDNEWDNAVKISLEKENTGMWANFYDENSRLPLYAYFYYGEDGIYVGADIYDNDVDTVNMHDCFEVAFNPGGLIPDGDKLEGLFFTFWLDGDGVLMKRHNRYDGDQTGEFEDGAVCKYALTDHGYTVEALIKWEWLTMSDRPVLNTGSGEYETGMLDKFDYSSDGAFTYAIVCYLNGNGEDSAAYRCVYRTVTDPSLAGNFSTATYDIKFTFARQEEQTTEQITETETETDTEQITETDAVTEETAQAPAGPNNITVWIIICAAVAAAVAAVTVVLIKRKK
ncbi:MAG: hypothetical protein IJT49_08690 [Clostridia bacterium]|nr:hypothetical protein [Clostridia bacterium]